LRAACLGLLRRSGRLPPWERAYFMSQSSNQQGAQQAAAGPPAGFPNLSSSLSGTTRSLARATRVIIISSVAFAFISYWRTAAVVLCDLASTVYYIEGIVESAIGPAAPFFILAVMLFSYAVRSVYIESCSLFVRGGVYRVVKEAMGGFLGKLSVSALMFDYILTGPTSGVSAGQYLVGLFLQIIKITSPAFYEWLGLNNDPFRSSLRNWGAVLLACLVTIYFFRQNLLGVHESSGKALKIMYATTIMAVIMLVWCLLTLAYKGGPVNPITWKPNLDKKYELATTEGRDPDTGEPREVWARDPETGGLKVARDEQGNPIPRKSEALAKLGIDSQEDPIGFFDRILSPETAARLRNPRSWLSIFGIIGLLMAFGHSILAMSGEETLAQVYREVESPKLKNFKKAAFIVFVYSILLTAGMSFLAVMLIPDEVRMKDYSENLIGGLARYVIGPPVIKLFLEGFVVVVGFLILAGAVNTAMIGSNGVLNRVAEDGVLPDWFLKPHPRYGTTYRVLWLILLLQLGVILFSGGDMIILGEAYAFGVVWSFVFKALAMVVLRFKDRSPREYKVPLNFHIGSVEIPFGLILIFLVLLSAALLNFFTKEVATVGGLLFTAVFLTIFMVSEHYHEKRRQGTPHEHMEQFNQQVSSEITPEGLGLKRAYRKLVAIRSTQNLFMLEKAIDETDPQTTDVVVMTAKQLPVGQPTLDALDITSYDQQLMTAVVTRAEKAGKQVKPLIVPTNNPLHAILQTAKDLQAHELILGASNIYTVEEQLDQVDFYWINLHDGNPPPLTVRLLTRDRDIYHDLAGGNRIPKISERRARSVAELRAAGIGVDKVLLLLDGTPGSADLFQDVLTMLDSHVRLGLLSTVASGSEPGNGMSLIPQEMERAKKLGRPVEVVPLDKPTPQAIVNYARENGYDVIIVGLPSEPTDDLPGRLGPDAAYIVQHAHCRVLLAAAPIIPTEVVDHTPSHPDIPPPPEHGNP
jgi:amino acid transporter/nucleotide-binding universal stress UspA family protein